MTYVTIDGTDHPFKFGMREIYEVSQSADVQPVGEEMDYDEALRRVSMDFDVFLKLFHMASKKGCRHHNKEAENPLEPLTAIEIEDAVDEDPGLFEALNKAFEQAAVVKHMEGGKKKDAEG